MSYALSTQGQGATAYAALPNWAINPNTSTGVNWIEIDFILHGPADNGIGYIFGLSNSTIFSVSVDTANKLRLVLSSVVIIEPVGTFVYGQRYTLRLEYNDTGSASTAWTRLYLNGAQIGSDYTGATSSIQINQIGRYSTTRHSPITVFSLKTGSSTLAAVGYVDEWNDSTAIGTGTTWPSVASTRNITITNATGAADSWWIFYSNVEEHFGTFTAQATITRALASTKEGLGSYARSMAISSSWAVQPSSYGTFSASYSIARAFAFNKETVASKPNQSLVISDNYTQAKQAVVNKPNQSLFSGIALTQAKQTIVNKPNQTLTLGKSFAQTKEVSVAKPNLPLLSSTVLTWEVFYGVGGSFASYMQVSKSLETSKQSLTNLAKTLEVSTSISTRKEATNDFAAALQTGFSGISSEKQALANIYSQMTASFNIVSTSKTSGSQFFSTMRIDGRLTGGTDEANAPRIITYTTNALSKRFYQSSAIKTRTI